MSSEQSEKLKLIRESERLKTKELAELIGINYYTYHGYESGKSKMPMEAGMKLFKHPRFRKYRDWFMFDETKDWLTIYSAYVCSKCTKENCINFQVVEVNSVIGGLYVY